MDRIVVVGAGLAGSTAAAELRRSGYQRELVVVGDEVDPPYRRPPLSKHPLPTALSALALPVPSDLDVDWRTATPATRLDPRERRVDLADGGSLRFDGLVIASGVRPRPLPFAAPRTGVLTLRSLGDARRLHGAVSARPRTVVLGGGLLGSEIAATLRTYGVPVTLVVRGRLPLERALGPELAEEVLATLRQHGTRVLVASHVVAIEGRDSVTGVRLASGAHVAADLVVAALGSVPATGWLASSGLDVRDGVWVDATGRAAPGVVAAGDVACWPRRHGGHHRDEHYHAAVAQGAHVARTLLGSAEPYRTPASWWTDVHDLRLKAVGRTGAGHAYHVVDRRPGGRFLAEYRSDGRVVGAITSGLVGRLGAYRTRLTEETP